MHYYADRLQSFVESSFGAQAHLEDYRDRLFKNENYYAALALNTVKSVALKSDFRWDFVLSSHGYHRKSDTTNYLRMIICDLKDLHDLSEDNHLQLSELPIKLQQAIELISNSEYQVRIASRKEQLTPL